MDFLPCFYEGSNLAENTHLFSKESNRADKDNMAHTYSNVVQPNMLQLPAGTVMPDFPFSTHIETADDWHMSSTSYESDSPISDCLLHTRGLKRSSPTIKPYEDAGPISKRHRKTKDVRSDSVSSTTCSKSSLAEDRNSPPSNEDRRAMLLERNRAAAARCRIKKKEWIDNLEAAAKQGSRQTQELQAIVHHLREELLVLRTRIACCGCGNVGQPVTWPPQ